MATSDAYRTNYALIDWSDFKPSQTVQAKPKGPSGPLFIPDIKEFVSPIDGSLIGSRSTLRAHEQRHGVRQCGELKTPQDFDVAPKRGEVTQRSERAMEHAYRVALQKAGL